MSPLLLIHLFGCCKENRQASRRSFYINSPQSRTLSTTTFPKITSFSRSFFSSCALSSPHYPLCYTSSLNTFRTTVMVRQSRRQAIEPDSDSDDDYVHPSQMSPDALREYKARLNKEVRSLTGLFSMVKPRLTTVQQDLGNATAEYITTTDYRRQRVSQASIIRRSDIVGTEEYKKAALNKSSAQNWNGKEPSIPWSCLC